MEVMRVGGGLEDNMAGGDDLDNNHDYEVEDRKLVCMVNHVVPLKAEQTYLVLFYVQES